MLLDDDIALTASAPEPVKGGMAQAVGQPGIQQFFYWIVARYPIGASVSIPIFIRNASSLLDADHSVQVVWDAALGAQSYDVLRTTEPEFPSVPGNYAVIAGTTQTSVLDQNNALSFYNPAGLPWGSPVRCHIHLNNRDFDRPTLQIPCGQMAVNQLIFPDGSVQSTGGGQTPWTSNIDGGGVNSLYNVGFIAVGSDSYNFPQGMTGAKLELSTDPGYAPGGIPASATIQATQRTYPPGGPIPLNIIAAKIVTQAGLGLNYQITDAINNQLQVNGTIAITGASNSFSGMNFQSQELEVFFWIYNTPPLGGYIRCYDTGADAHLPLNLDGSQLNLNTFSNGPVVISLPTTAPAAGSHQLWADPADAYTVKWAV